MRQSNFRSQNIITFSHIHMLHNSLVPFKQAQHVEQWVAVRRILYSEAEPGGADPDLSLRHPEPGMQV